MGNSQASSKMASDSNSNSSSSSVLPLTVASFRGARTNGIKTGIVRMTLEPKLLQLLQECDEFETDPSKPKPDRPGFFGPLNDGPHMPKSHVYYEGYFASSPVPLDSMNPRFGSAMLKPAAPAQLRAFLTAFKKVNAKWLLPLLGELEVDMLTPETAFSDIAAQSHHGDAVSVSCPGLGEWHFDAPNSLLHLAVSIHGDRKLHVQHHERSKCDSSRFVSKTGVHNMTAGDVYLTSPSAFMHAVAYPACSYDDRVLACQCRTLVISPAEVLGQQESEGVDWDRKAQIVGQALLGADVRLPTFAEVTQQMEEMAESDARSSVRA